jgi:hypothetical protein
MHVHCSMTGEKEDSFALRSARRSLRSSCHAGSAMRVSQRLSRTPGCYGPGPIPDLTLGGPGRPDGRTRELPPKRPRGAKAEACTTLTTATHGSRPSQGTFLSSFFFDPFDSPFPGYHSRRQWVSRFTLPLLVLPLPLTSPLQSR